MAYGFNGDRSKVSVPTLTAFQDAMQADTARDNAITGHEARIAGLEQQVSTLSKITGEGGVETSIADLIYPVGAIYISTSNADPGTLFGGTWARITGKFLLAGTTGGAEGGNGTAEVAPGGTGGQATVTLSAAQSGVAPHGHGFTQPKTPVLPHSVTQPAFKLPNHSHAVTTYADTASTRGNRRIRGTEYATESKAAVGGTGNPSSLPACTRTTNVAVAAHAAANCTGGAVSNHAGAAASQAHNNMPPYLAVYVWERTA